MKSQVRGPHCARILASKVEKADANPKDIKMFYLHKILYLVFHFFLLSFKINLLKI